MRWMVVLGLAAGLPAAELRSLTLPEVIALSALTAEVRSAQVQIDGDGKRLWAERMALLPRVSLSGQAARQISLTDTYSDIPPERLGPYNTLDGRIQVGQALLDRAAWSRTDAARQQVDVARAGLRLAQDQSAGDAAQAWINLARFQAQEQERQTEVLLALKLLDLSQSQLDAGATDGLAVSRAMSRLAEARTDLARAGQQRDQAALELARVVNLDPTTALGASGPLDETTVAEDQALPLDQALVQATAQRPELDASRFTIARLEALRRVEASGRWPVLEAFGNYGFGGPDIHDTRSRWEVGLRLSVTLVDGSGFRASAVDADRRREELRREDLLRQIRAEVQSAHTAGRNGLQVVVAAREEQRVSEDQLERATTRFARGAAANTDVIDAQLAVSRAVDKVVDACARLAIARVQFAVAVGAITGLR